MNRGGVHEIGSDSYSGLLSRATGLFLVIKDDCDMIVRMLAVGEPDTNAMGDFVQEMARKKNASI